MKIEQQNAVVRYGPKKLGQEEFDRQAASKVGRATPSGVVFGNRKAEANEAVQPPAAPDLPESGEKSEGQEESKENPFVAKGDEDASGRTTIAELEQILAEDPEMFDLAFEAEFKDGKPRKGACRALLAAEKAKPEPRAQIVKVLEGHV